MSDRYRFFDSMCGGAWPFLVRGAIRMVHFDNKRETGRLTSLSISALAVARRRRSHRQ